MKRLSFQAFVLLWTAIFAVLTIFLHYIYENAQTSIREGEESKNHTIKFKELIHSNESAISIIIPYIDKALPVWFDAFVASTESRIPNNHSLVIHWLIFHNQRNTKYYDSSNVKLIYLHDGEFTRRFATLRKNHGPDSKSFSLQVPYRMVEYKAAFGYLFQDFLAQYSHWGYGDLDILASTEYLQNVLSFEASTIYSQEMKTQLLQKFDVITFTYGDHSSLYLRGQLTIFKKTSVSVEEIWRDCIIDVDMKDGMKGFQSAEGCFSKVVTTKYSSLSILYLPIQFSDALLLRGKYAVGNQYRLAERESYYYKGKILKCYLNESLLDYKFSERFFEQLLSNPEPLQLQSTRSYTQDWWEVHLRPPRCSYWIAPEYDVSCRLFMYSCVTVEIKTVNNLGRFAWIIYHPMQ